MSVVLKKNKSQRFGIPYQGSKGKIIPEIAKYFPNAENFYDLFGGGFSATHYMMARRKNSFKNFHYNEIRSGMCELIKDAIDGKYNYDVFKPEWISREKFFAEKESNAYIKIIWSFGNNGEGYLFGEDLEEIKKSMHMAVVFEQFDDLFVDTFRFSKWPKNLTITGRRLFLREVNRRLKRQERSDLEQLQQLQQLLQLEQLERLQQLQQLERLQQLEQLEQRLFLTNKDYRDVEIGQRSIIYCDIPYKGTTDYGSEFNHDEFFDWAHNQKDPVFISEYNIDDKRFHLIKTIKHRSTFASGKNSEVKERLYCNAAAMRILNNS